jgi:AraC-like DNA-binding protein
MAEAATVWPVSWQASNELANVSTLVADLLAKAKEAFDRDHETARRCIAHAAAVVERIDRRPGRDKGSADQGGLAPWQVRRVKAFIDANLADRIALKDLGAVARLSISHFSRAFKRSFGMAPYAYVLRRRIEYAQRLMLTTDSPLCQIALECGLSDQSHFSRLFQRTIGASPNEWRRFRRVGEQATPAHTVKSELLISHHSRSRYDDYPVDREGCQW